MPVKVVSAHVYGKRLEEILGLKRIRTVDFHFHMQEAVTAHVTFFLNDVQANEVVELLENCRRKSPQLSDNEGCDVENAVENVWGNLVPPRPESNGRLR